GARRTLRELRAAAGPLIVTGLINSAIPIFAITWAETRLDSGLTAIIQASAPLFTALLALRFSRGDRVRGSRLAGLVVGFAGVALLVGGRPSGQIVAALPVGFSAVCHAAAALYPGRRLRAASCSCWPGSGSERAQSVWETRGYPRARRDVPRLRFQPRRVREHRSGRRAQAPPRATERRRLPHRPDDARGRRALPCGVEAAR